MSERERKGWTGVQLALGWLPVWLLFALGMQRVHGLGLHQALHLALLPVATAGGVGLVVLRLTRRWPWPHPMRAGFLLRHLLAALGYCLAWGLLDRFVTSLFVGWGAWRPSGFWWGYPVVGGWFYAMLTAFGYAQRAAAREAELRLAATQAQLGSLRAQLQPHFLFNALHTVVQLIPLDPAAAARAAEQLAQLLRRGVTPPAERIALREEWRAVQLYLGLEAIRFGERLRVQAELPDEVQDALLPAFALQTLVENAVAHGAAPRVAATTVRVRAWRDGAALWVEVRDDGAGADPARPTQGSGLQRLRERLALLHGDAAALQLQGQPGQGYCARLRLPWERA